MNYIILDMEWNQAGRGSKLVRSPIILHGEIIQIGAVKTDEDFNYLDKIKISVCPKYYKTMNTHVEKITGITSARLTYGEMFPKAFERLKRWCGEEMRFITWGFDDISMLSDNLTVHGLPSDYGADFINLQLIFNDQISGDRPQWSLSDACEKLGIEMEAHAHDAMNDAWYTYEVLKKLDMKKGLSDYPKLAEEVKLPLRREYINRVPRGKAMTEDERINDTRCPKCRKRLSLLPWVFYGSGKHASIASCETDGKFLIRLTSTGENAEYCTVTRITYEADEKSISAYNKKSEKAAAAKERAKAKREMALENNSEEDDGII